jgi:predicted transcriptional regulator
VYSLVQAEKRLRELHRSRIDIIASILHAAEGGAKKTHIMYQCNLSFRQLHAYLDFLTERELLKSVVSKADEKNEAITYETTSKGKAFIQAYRVINVILSS